MAAIREWRAAPLHDDDPLWSYRPDKRLARFRLIDFADVMAILD